MKKVLFTATVDSHILHFHLPYLKMFKEKGYEVHVATNTDDTIPFCDIKHKVCFERSPFKKNNLKAIKQMEKILLDNNFDIVHTHTPMGSVVTRLAYKKVRNKVNTRMIYTAHGFHFYKGAPLLNWVLFYPVEKYLSKYTDTLITINKEDYEFAKKKFKKCRSVEYVPGVGIDEDKFNFTMTKSEKLELRKSLGLKENDFVLIYPAEISKRKRHIWLINTISPLLMENRHIHLLLPGSDSLNGKAHALTKKMGLTDQIHFLGYRTDIPKLLRISDLAISSAKQEGLPVNIMEAMYVGLSVVATDCRGNRDLICNSKNGYIVSINNNDDFVNKIELVYNDRNIRRKFEKENRILIKDYLLDDILTRMNVIYNKTDNILIIPTCTDLNRGDQALVLETKKIVEKVYPNCSCYMMSNGETIQCENMGINVFSDILKHPSRFDRNKNNINYNIIIKIKWGIVALFDYIISKSLLYKPTRKLVYPFLSKESKKTLNLYKSATAIYVKGGGFLHDYSKGFIGIYTIYYQLFHIRLGLAMKKNVFIMPNSYGPFVNKYSKKIVNKTLDKCRLVTARESISSSSKTNTLNRNIELFPDLAFFLDKNNSKYNFKKLFNSYGINLKKDRIVAITVRPYRFYSYDNPEKKYYDYKKSFVEFIEYLTSDNYKVFLVVHTRAENEHENDEACIDDIIKMVKNKQNVYKIKDDTMNCYDLKKLYGYCKYMIGTRFHSVIFSIEQFIPCVAVTYGGNKGDGIMKDLGLEEYSIKIGELNSKLLISTFNKMVKDKKNINTKINNYLNYSKKKYDNLISLLSDIK